MSQSIASQRAQFMDMAEKHVDRYIDGDQSRRVNVLDVTTALREDMYSYSFSGFSTSEASRVANVYIDAMHALATHGGTKGHNSVDDVQNANFRAVRDCLFLTEDAKYVFDVDNLPKDVCFKCRECLLKVESDGVIPSNVVRLVFKIRGHTLSHERLFTDDCMCQELEACPNPKHVKLNKMTLARANELR